MNTEEKALYLNQIQDLKADNIYMKSRIKKLETQVFEANLLLKEINIRPIIKVICKGIDINPYIEKWGL